MRNRFLAIAVVALLAASVAWAAGGGEKAKSGKMDPAAKAAKLQEKLGLTDEQTAQVQDVYQETHDRYRELKASGLEGDALKAEKKKLIEQRNAKLKDILTAEQWAKYEEMRAAPRKQARESEPKG
jgi:hypothetical protein